MNNVQTALLAKNITSQTWSFQSSSLRKSFATKYFTARFTTLYGQFLGTVVSTVSYLTKHPTKIATTGIHVTWT